jgi:hypothetical protein
MASFDFGQGAAGGRIMMLFERRRVALFTGEGGAIRVGNSVALGPLVLDADPDASSLRFGGPAVVVDDGTAYLSVEGALADGRLDPMMTVDLSLDFDDGAVSFGDLLASLEAVLRENSGAPTPERLARAAPPHSSFGTLHGLVTLDGVERSLSAIARVGVSFVGLGPQKFSSRRMLWAYAPRTRLSQALELRSLAQDDGSNQHSAYLRHAGRWQEAQISRLDLETASPYTPPHAISVALRLDSAAFMLEGSPATFMTLSRPGLDGARIHTSLGFASFRFDGDAGVGMYEYSRRVGGSSGSGETEDE